MSQTSKDSARQSTRRTVLEVVGNGDGTYEIILNKEVVASGIPERWLDEGLLREERILRRRARFNQASTGALW